MPPANLAGTCGYTPNRAVYTAQSTGIGKLRRRVGNGGGTEGRRRTDPKERFHLCFISPATYRAPAPSSFGELLHFIAEAQMTGSSTLFREVWIMPVAFRGLGWTHVTSVLVLVSC